MKRCIIHIGQADAEVYHELVAWSFFKTICDFELWGCRWLNRLFGRHPVVDAE
jgi:hypothetical protein